MNKRHHVWRAIRLARSLDRAGEHAAADHLDFIIRTSQSMPNNWNQPVEDRVVPYSDFEDTFEEGDASRNEFIKNKVPTYQGGTVGGDPDRNKSPFALNNVEDDVPGPAVTMQGGIDDPDMSSHTWDSTYGQNVADGDEWANNMPNRA